MTWVEPDVVIQVGYAELTPDGILRAASYQGIVARSNRRGAGTLGSAARRPEFVRPPGLRAELVGAALLGAELISAARFGTEDIGPTRFGTKLIGAAGLGAEQARTRLGLIRGSGIACHVNLLQGCLHRVLPGLGGKDTAWPLAVG